MKDNQCLHLTRHSSIVKWCSIVDVNQSIKKKSIIQCTNKTTLQNSFPTKTMCKQNTDSQKVTEETMYSQT